MKRGLGLRTLVLVVLAAAVALVAVAVSSGPVRAADVPLAADGNSATAAPGDTVQITVAGALAQVSITGTGDGVGASFAANDGQSINCSDGLACDENDTPNEIQVDLEIDADSAEGYILVSVLGVGGDSPTPQTTKVITVSKATLLGSLDAETSSKTIAANDDNNTRDDSGPNEADILATVTSAASEPAGLNEQRVTFVTSLGSLACPASTAPTTGGDAISEASGVQVCSVWTSNQDNPLTTENDAADGFATVRLDGGGVEGVATVTVTVGGLTEQLDVTMYGEAENLTAEPQQTSVEIGGSVFVVLTVTDDAGNPVSGQVIGPVTTPADEVVGPEGVDAPVLVVTETNTDAVTDESAAGVGYSKDLIDTEDSNNNIPACGDDNTGDQENPSTEVFIDDGTNADGQCVVYVTAPEDTADATNNATRGEHTLNFAIDTIEASATIEVAGSPHRITTDAPETVDPASVTEITVSVWDDTDVLVGITDVTVRKVGGDGLIEDQGAENTEETTDGQSAFTFISPSTVGTAEILITAGEVDHRVTLNIGEPEPDEPVEPVLPALVELSDGAIATFVGWRGGETTAAQVFENVPNLTVVWKYDGSSWHSYVSAADAPDLLKDNFSLAPYDSLFIVTTGPVTVASGY